MSEGISAREKRAENSTLGALTQELKEGKSKRLERLSMDSLQCSIPASAVCLTHTYLGGIVAQGAGWLVTGRLLV